MFKARLLLQAVIRSWDVTARSGLLVLAEGTFPALVRLDGFVATPEALAGAQMACESFEDVANLLPLRLVTVVQGNIVWVYDRVEGVSTARIVELLRAAGRVVPSRVAVEVAAGVADALAGIYAVNTGMWRGVHPGCGPDQVLLTAVGGVVVAGATLEGMSAVHGRVGYRPPEGGTGHGVYQAAGLLVELLCGEPMPAAETTAARQDAMVRRLLIRVLARPGDIPGETVARLLQQALSFDPARRGTVAAFASQLHTLAQGLPVPGLRSWAPDVVGAVLRAVPPVTIHPDEDGCADGVPVEITLDDPATESQGWTADPPTSGDTWSSESEGAQNEPAAYADPGWGDQVSLSEPSVGRRLATPPMARRDGGVHRTEPSLDLHRGPSGAADSRPRVVRVALGVEANPTFDGPAMGLDLGSELPTIPEVVVEPGRRGLTWMAVGAILLFVLVAGAALWMARTPTTEVLHPIPVGEPVLQPEADVVEAVPPNPAAVPAPLIVPAPTLAPNPAPNPVPVATPIASPIHAPAPAPTAAPIPVEPTNSEPSTERIEVQPPDEDTPVRIIAAPATEPTVPQTSAPQQATAAAAAEIPALPGPFRVSFVSGDASVTSMEVRCASGSGAGASSLVIAAVDKGTTCTITGNGADAPLLTQVTVMGDRAYTCFRGRARVCQ